MNHSFIFVRDHGIGDTNNCDRRIFNYILNIRYSIRWNNTFGCLDIFFFFGKITFIKNFANILLCDLRIKQLENISSMLVFNAHREDAFLI